MNNGHPWQLKKNQNTGGRTANSTYSPRKWAKWAELAVLFSWQHQNGPHNLDFFNCHGCRFELISNVNLVRQFFMRNESILGGVLLYPKTVMRNITLCCTNLILLNLTPRFFWPAGFQHHLFPGKKNCKIESKIKVSQNQRNSCNDFWLKRGKIKKWVHYDSLLLSSMKTDLSARQIIS